jgi:hypothetical protein
MFSNPLARTIAEFLGGIGIAVVPTPLECDTFLPGIQVEDGRLLVDESKLTWPGDLLHEAGHLAVVPAPMRSRMSGDVALPGLDMDGLEVQATAWAYAAVVHLGLPPDVLFHEGGYRGQSAGLIRTYGLGVYPGAHKLTEYGMADGYPRMARWLRD